MLAVKPADLSSIPGTYTVESTDFSELFSDFHLCGMASVYAHAHRNTHIKKKEKQVFKRTVVLIPGIM